jgi:hypothetical protein
MWIQNASEIGKTWAWLSSFGLYTPSIREINRPTIVAKKWQLVVNDAYLNPYAENMYLLAKMMPIAEQKLKAMYSTVVASMFA